MRDHLDRYYTPEFAVEDLWRSFLADSYWGFQKDPILEPCAGQGHISRVLTKYGYSIVTGDVDPNVDVDYHWDFIQAAADFSVPVKAVVTNPPYRVTYEGTSRKKYTLADFAKACLTVSPNVAILTRLAWLELCGDREDLFRNNPPSKILLLPRVEFTDPQGNNVGSGTSMPSIWVIWEEGHKGPTEFTWIKSTKNGRRKETT